MNAPMQRIYLDLDRTLFDTAKFMPVLFKAAETLYGVSADHIRRNMHLFSYKVGDMKTYNFFDQVTALGVGEDEATRDINHALAGQDFLFPDARELLQFLKRQPFDLHVLSFGKTNYQTLKYNMTPELRGIPLTVVFENKARYLARQAAKTSLLIDDKIVPSLPEWCSQLYIQRGSPHSLKKDSGGRLWHINNLKFVETFLAVRYNEPNQKGALA